MAALSIGTLSLSEGVGNSITVSLSAGLSGGTGTGYSYSIYRGTDPNFAVGSGTLLNTVSSMPYTDTSVVWGTQYFYGVVGADSSAATVNSLPAGLSGASNSDFLYSSAAPNSAGLNIVFVGDSITYGIGVTNPGTVLSPTVPFFTMAKLQRLLGTRRIFGSNRGISGYTTTDWLPGGGTYNGAVQASNLSSAASVLNTANPSAQTVFNIMLGTNDTASSGTNNGAISGGLSASQYSANLKLIVDQILKVDWPSAKVFLHQPIWYSPNCRNGAVYLQAGLSRLFSYRSALVSLVSTYVSSNPNQVFVGDTYGFDYFAKNYQSEQQAESGTDGTFFLHPSGSAGSNGFVGTQTLGEMWAEAMANSLYRSATVAPSPYTFF